MKPKYKHDCDGCIWLGSITYPGPLTTGEAPLRNADLYFCKEAEAFMGGTVIARHSSEGSNYSSFPVDLIVRDFINKKSHEYSTSLPALITAYHFARAKKLIP